MADERPPTKPGTVYWVEVDGVRMKLEAVERCMAIPGWWACRAPLGTEIVIEETAIIEPVTGESRYAS